MVSLQNAVFKQIKSDVLSSTAAETSDAVDCRDAHYAVFLIGGEAATATDASQTLTSLVLTEGDTTTSFSNVSGFIGGTDFTIPVNNDTATRLSVRFNVDLRKRKRYLQVSMRAAAASSVNTFASVALGRANETPNSATEAGVLTQVTG